MPTFSAHGLTSVKLVENDFMEEVPLTTVCVNWMVDHPTLPSTFFYTRACAEIFVATNGGTIIKGNFCVDYGLVFICL